ncbi:MAG: hypothetical protein AB7H43_01745 [Acidimicrobiia bacterium]
MSAVPTTEPTESVAPSIGRAYDELASGLLRLAEAVRQGDLSSLSPAPGARPAPPRGGGDDEAGAPAPRALVAAPPGDALGDAPADAPGAAGDRLLATAAIEVLKTGVVVLAVYQGLLSLLPAPERPRFAPDAASSLAPAPAPAAPAAGQASPAVSTGVPSVAPVALVAAGGQPPEVEVDGDGRTEPKAVP